jgi:hypothetical protein
MSSRPFFSLRFLSDKMLLIARLTLAILAIYLEWALPLGQKLFVPHFLAFLLALTLIPQIRAWRRFSLAMLLMLGFCAFNLSTSAFGSVPLHDRFRSVIYFVYLFGIALIIGVTKIIGESPLDRRIAATMFLGAGFSLLAFASVEQHTALYQVSDAFRSVAYKETNADNEARDLELLQKVRPKAFAQETSFGSRGVSVLLLIGALLSRDMMARVAALMGIVAAIPIFGSPIPAAFAVGLLYGLWVPRWAQSPKILPLYLGTITAGAAVLLFIVAQFSVVVQRRLDLVRDGTDPSTYMRTMFMMEMAGKAINWNPISGVGLGGEEELSSEFVLPLLENVPTNTLINNALWSVPFFTGLVGSLAFLLLLLTLTWRVELRYRAVFFATLLLILNCTGAIHSSSVWIVGAFLYSILRVPAAARAPRKVVWARRVPARPIAGGLVAATKTQPLLHGT